MQVYKWRDMQGFSPSLYYFSTLSEKPPTASVELCCTSGDTQLQKGTYKTSFVPPVLASCMFQITVEDPVSYIQSTTLSKWSDMKIYISENAPIWVLFTFEGTKKAKQQCTERNSAPWLWNKLPNHIKVVAIKDIFDKVSKIHLFKLAYS